MLETIKEKLKEIEERESVKILHCVESGSRAWGFASPDSDYDVRFIYVRPKEHYLRLDKAKDVIEWQLDGTLDINGWDLQKALKLLYKSNPTLFEWNSSPRVYQTTGEWKEVSSVIEKYFSAEQGLHHYLNIAKSNYRKYLNEDAVRFKKYFYVLRPLLACKWILQQKTPPPMLFESLADKYLDESVKPDVKALLKIKTEMPEISEGKHFDRIDEYLLREINEIEQIISEFPEKEPQSWEPLNELFFKLI